MGLCATASHCVNLMLKARRVHAVQTVSCKSSTLDMEFMSVQQLTENGTGTVQVEKLPILMLIYTGVYDNLMICNGTHIKCNLC